MPDFHGTSRKNRQVSANLAGVRIPMLPRHLLCFLAARLLVEAAFLEKILDLARHLRWRKRAWITLQATGFPM